MEHRRGQARQLAGFVQTQQRQQAGVFHLARIRAVHPGNVAQIVTREAPASAPIWVAE